MATELRLDPELAEAVRLARRRAEEMGELPRGPFTPFESTLPPEARELIAGWLRDGGYDESSVDGLDGHPGRLRDRSEGGRSVPSLGE